MRFCVLAHSIKNFEFFHILHMRKAARAIIMRLTSGRAKPCPEETSHTKQRGQGLAAFAPQKYSRAPGGFARPVGRSVATALADDSGGIFTWLKS